MKLDSQCWEVEDHDLSRRIANFLRTCRVPAVAGLHFQVDRGHVTIKDEFASAHDKHLCHELIRHVRGVFSVVHEGEQRPMVECSV